MNCFLCDNPIPKKTETCKNPECFEFIEKFKTNIRRGKRKNIGEKGSNSQIFKSSKVSLFDGIILADRRFLKDAKAEASFRQNATAVEKVLSRSLKYLPYDYTSNSILNIYNIFKKYAPKTLHSQKYSFLATVCYSGSSGCLIEFHTLEIVLSFLRALVIAFEYHQKKYEVDKEENIVLKKYLNYELRAIDLTNIFMLYDTFDNKVDNGINKPISTKVEYDAYLKEYDTISYFYRRSFLEDFIPGLFLQIIKQKAGNLGDHLYLLFNRSSMGLLAYAISCYWEILPPTGESDATLLPVKVFESFKKNVIDKNENDLTNTYFADIMKLVPGVDISNYDELSAKYPILRSFYNLHVMQIFGRSSDYYLVIAELLYFKITGIFIDFRNMNLRGIKGDKDYFLYKRHSYFTEELTTESMSHFYINKPVTILYNQIFNLPMPTGTRKKLVFPPETVIFNLIAAAFIKTNY